MPCALVNFVTAFAPLFSKPVFQSAKVLLVGAVPSPASRTVPNALPVMGLSEEKHFQNYHLARHCSGARLPPHFSIFLERF